MSTQEDSIKFLIHHGMSITMVTIIIGLIYMLQVVEIKNKIPVDILYIDNNYIAYMTKNNNFKPVDKSTINIDISGKDKLYFEIRTVKEEPLYFFMEVFPISSKQELDDSFERNSRISGFMFTNDVKLWSLVFSKWRGL